MSDNNLTIRKFFECKYVPLRLTGASETTAESYKEAIRAWESCMGSDWTIQAIDQEALSTFISRYRQRVYRGKPVTINTVRSRLRHLYAILRLAGPAGYRAPDSLGLIASVPYVRPPRPIRRDPEPSESRDIQKLWGVLDQAKFPVVDYFPGDWWRALLSVSVNTALRIKTLLSLEWSMIRDGVLRVPGENMKGRKDETYPLLPFTLQRLAYLGSCEGLIFPFPHHRSTFFAELRRLNKAAGISKDQNVTIHGIRRFVLNRFADDAPASVQKIAGHASASTTMESYVSWQRVEKAITSLDLCQEVLNDKAE